MILVRYKLLELYIYIVIILPNSKLLYYSNHLYAYNNEFQNIMPSRVQFSSGQNPEGVTVINYDNPQACILTINGRLHYENTIYDVYGTISAIRTSRDGQNTWLYASIPDMADQGWFAMLRVRFYPAYLDLYYDCYVGNDDYPIGQITGYSGLIF